VKVGLRIDVDTLRGTARGVPALVELLARHEARGSFFLSVGPDNMGRHLWRLLRPAFLAKMLRTRAAKLYGWDVLLRGTLFPGPRIGERAAPVIRDLAASGQEIGLHAWDHHAWQTHVARMSGARIADHLRRGMGLLERLTGSPVTCSATPAWRTTDVALAEKRRFPFVYNSDCRGGAPFLPLLDDGTLAQLQIPSTLPTYDERVGQGVSAEGYYDELLAELEAQERPVATIHAEVEGIVALELFESFVTRALARGHRFVSLGELAAEVVDPPVRRMVRLEVAGREGWASSPGEVVQTPAAPAFAGGLA
jgi:undecaprenyl phosphate-alpha-L-ara4FN deformylase